MNFVETVCVCVLCVVLRWRPPDAAAVAAVMLELLERGRAELQRVSCGRVQSRICDFQMLCLE